jgi:hypothetical protein
MARISSLRFLNTEHPDLLAQAVPVDQVFTLLPPKFEPLTNEPDLDDGVPPTAIGKAVMRWYAEAHQCSPVETPAAVVRAIEAISATSENIEAIKKARWRRNHAGMFSVAQLEVLVPVIRGATVQPRMAASAQRIMRDDYGQSLIHEIGPNLTVSAQSAQHLLNITEAQRKVRNPGLYVTDAEKEFVDSIALEGIREELRGYVYDLRVTEAEHGHSVETDDGWTRLNVAQSFMGQLMGVDADLSTRHWENTDGTYTVRPFTPDAIEAMHKQLRFAEARFEVWPAVHTTAGVGKWVANASAEAQANIRMMTTRMDIGIAVRPYGTNTDHDVVYADMARFHVRGQNPTLWGKADDEVFKARTVVNDLVRRNYITDKMREAYFGDVLIPWADDPTRRPFRNRVVAITDVMISTVVDDPNHAGRYPEIRSTLKRLRVSNSPLQAATTTASLAGLVAGLDGDGEMGQFTAAIARSFRKPELRAVKTHVGNWTEQICRDPVAIAESARKELDAVLGSAKVLELGPNQRALAILALVAHASNPALRKYEKPIAGTTSSGKPKTVRWPSSMTMTGRGGRGGVLKVEADVIFFHAVRSPEGIDELEAIIKATICASPIVPISPATGEEMLEEWLRRRWEKAPDPDGKVQANSRFTADQDEDDGQGEAAYGQAELVLTLDRGLADPRKWQAEMVALVDDIGALRSRVDALADVRADAISSGFDPEDYDLEDEDAPRMIDIVGIEPEVDDGSDEYLDTIRKFLKRGVLAYYAQQMRR